MRLKVKTVMDGPGPSQAIVAVDTKEGRQEEVVLDRGLIRDDSIEVARIIEREDSALVELPQESASGNWRIWVANDSLE